MRQLARVFRIVLLSLSHFLLLSLFPEPTKKNGKKKRNAVEEEEEEVLEEEEEDEEFPSSCQNKQDSHSPARSWPGHLLIVAFLSFLSFIQRALSATANANATVALRLKKKKGKLQVSFFFPARFPCSILFFHSLLLTALLLSALLCSVSQNPNRCYWMSTEDRLCL